MFDAQKADRAVEFIECLKHTKGKHYGKPFKLLPWQRQIVRDVYGTINDITGVRQYKYVYLEIPKKNGKSELVAALALLQLVFDGEMNGEVYGCAGDRQQASLVFDVAVAMVKQEPTLKKRLRITPSHKRITDPVTGSFYQVVSAEAYTKHGLNLSACIFDELHVQPNRELYDVMTKGAGDARAQPLWWIITTAGMDPDRTSIAWEVHEKAEHILKARAAGKTDQDIRTWYPVIYGYPGEDIYNEKHWRAANPSLGVTFSIDRLREAAEEARQNPADELAFRWLRLNQWVTTKLASWLPLDLYDATGVPDDWTRSLLEGKVCYPGLDLSSTTDLSSLCLVFPPQQDLARWHVIWDGWVPEENMQKRIREDHVPYDQWVAGGWLTPTPGSAIDYSFIEDRIVESSRMYRFAEGGADKKFATMLLQRLDQNHGLVFADIPQEYKYLTEPMQLIEVLLKKGELRHENNPVARWCFGNTSIASNGSGLIKYVKETRGKVVRRTKRIDFTAAWVIAMARAMFHENATITSNPLEFL